VAKNGDSQVAIDKMWCPPVQDATRDVPSLAYNSIKALRIPSAFCKATTYVFLCPARQWFKKVDFYRLNHRLR
jgi:hypothetical protein